MHQPRFSALVLLAALAAMGGRATAAVTAEQSDFFETKVRPVLADNCFRCHGPEKQKGGLRLDSRAALRRGTDESPVIADGHWEQSKLLTSVRREGENPMPPKDKLDPAQVEALVQWVKMGAPYTDKTPLAEHASAPDPAQHWAFQPVRLPPLPTVKNTAWIKSPLDSLVLAKLESKGMIPAPQADRRTLIRRATFDLTGLPPTPEEVDAFLAECGATEDKEEGATGRRSESSPSLLPSVSPSASSTAQAYERLIDRLLASPRYGERWGRHWLDVARYADTKGYVFNEDRRYPYAYTYRDWVIRALNEDLPYDRFLVAQIAADQMPGARPGDLAALGFLTVGRRFLNQQPEIIDDRLDVVCRGTMALTVACARCHDHKFDPIPTADYYSLYGVFASSTEPEELPLLGPPETGEGAQRFTKELDARTAKITAFIAEKRAAIEPKLRTEAKLADYLLTMAETRGLPAEKVKALAQSRDLLVPVIEQWRRFLGTRPKDHDSAFVLFRTLAGAPEDEVAAKAAELLAPTAKQPPNRLVAAAFRAKPPQTLRDVAALYGSVLGKVAAAKSPLPNPDAESLRQILQAPDSPTVLAPDEVEKLLPRPEQDKLKELRKKVVAWQAESPDAPPRGMVVCDLPTPVEPRIFIRGKAGNDGASVPRQFLQIVAGPERKPFQKGSGRLELAQAIASKDNPLTARVMANRVWLHHFGAGLVRTPGDFGVRTEPPLHAELLDYLAARFVADGWSLKKLHRLIMLSATYQQGRGENPDYLQTDPDNQLLWQMPGRRLDFEATRDALLAVAGTLDLKPGGRAADISSNRRTVYASIDRQNLPGIFRTFDFASPDTSNAQRHQTVGPQQALFMLNSGFVTTQVRALIARQDFQKLTDETARLKFLYRQVYARNADESELQLGLAFLASAAPPPSPLSAWEKLAQVLLASNEFVFVD
ncbi:MAG: PSD1 and planctomycete cytochrome C domain-containing protein [Chthoniobacter sp.]|nr:PSD1 and planctomycete cytochrome C domain-containing protein [Chthoniobacter sp.]